MQRTLLAITLAACTSAPRTSDRSASELPRVSSGSEKQLGQAILDLQGRMHERFTATENMREAITLSDLERAHREGQRIADLDEPDMLPQWKPFIDDIRTAARAVIATQDPAAAARSTAALGRACGRCHEAAGAKPGLVASPAPEPQPQLRATMASHQRGATLMWQGVMMPSSERWLEGARSLTTVTIAITAEANEPPNSLGISDDVSRIRLLARRAQTIGDLDGRAELYGELLGTCVRCHQTIRDR